MIDTLTRVETFRRMLSLCHGMPGHASEYRNVGALLMVGMVFLIGKEKEAHEALKAIADEKFVRRTEIQPIPGSLKKRRKKSTCSVLACIFYFREDVPSDEMLDIIRLLVSLSVDASLKEFNDILTPIIRDTVLENTDLWQRLEREFPDACRMIEAEIMEGPEGDPIREDLRNRLGIEI